MSHTGRCRRIVGAMLSGVAARLVTSLATLIALPLALRYLGAERYGVWATVTTTAVWMNLLDLGVANTLTNHISRAYALDDKQAARHWFTNALVVTAGMSILAGMTFVSLFATVDWRRLFNVTAHVSSLDVKGTVFAAVLLVLLGIPCSLAAKLLAGYQELSRYNYAMCVGAAASVVGLGLGMEMHVSMPVLFMMSSGCITGGSLAALLATLWQKRWLIPRVSNIGTCAMRELLKSGWAFFLLQASAVVVFSSDNLVVSHYLGAAEVTPYSVTWRLASVAALLQSLLFPALWPAYAEARARRDYCWIRRTFRSTLKGVVVLNATCAVTLIGYGRSAIRWWAGPTAVPTQKLAVAMALWIVISGVMTMESCLLAALERVREQAILSAAAAALNLGLSILLVQRVGSLGAILGTIVSYIVVLVIPQTMIVRRVWRGELAAGNPVTGGSITVTGRQVTGII